MATFRTAVLITNILAGALAVALAGFAIGFSWILFQAFMGTSFPMGLSGSPSSIENSFAVYGFISVEAVFVGVVLYLGYTTLRNALRPKVIEVEVEP